MPDMERSRQSWDWLTSLRMPARDDGAMKRATALSRLSEVADGLERAKVWSGPCVVAGYVFGALLEPAGDLERVQLALVIDEPVEDVPWMSRPRHLEALASLLRFDRLPMSWWWRPRAWPVWNHEITRAVCFWSATTGSDQGGFDALSVGRVDTLEFVQPAHAEQLIEELVLELDIGRRHLADAVAGFYDRGWRREHTGDGVYPADHLWWGSLGLPRSRQRGDGRSSLNRPRQPAPYRAFGATSCSVWRLRPRMRSLVIKRNDCNAT